MSAVSPSLLARSTTAALVLAMTACASGGDARPADSAATAAPAGSAAPTAGVAPAAQPGATPAGEPDSLVRRADLSRIMGDSAARVWMVIVSDFECPYCKMWHDSVDQQLRDEYVKTGKVRLAFVNFPLSQHPNAVPASEAAMCAGAQGKFWEMHDAIFATQAQWKTQPGGMPTLLSLANRIGVDYEEVQRCMQADRMVPMIQSDYQRAVQAGANSTPTFIIGSQRLSGVVPMADLRRVLDAAIAGTGGAR
jgi:protein-disulfide isomerase